MKYKLVKQQTKNTAFFSNGNTVCGVPISAYICDFSGFVRYFVYVIINVIIAIDK